MPIKFRSGWVPFIAAVLVIAIGIALGQWQTRRALQKEAIERTMSAREAAPPVILGNTGASAGAPDELEYRRVSASGEFLAAWPVYLDNRPYQGQAGFYLLMPFRLAGTDRCVLVERGWVRRDAAERTKLPQIATPQGQVTIEGVARRHPGRVYELGEAPPLRPGAIVQNLDVEAFAHAAGLSMLPFIIEQTSDTRDGLVRDWPRPSAGADRHRGYAFQWYALAAMALVFYLVTGFRRGRT